MLGFFKKIINAYLRASGIWVLAVFAAILPGVMHANSLDADLKQATVDAKGGLVEATKGMEHVEARLGFTKDGPMSAAVLGEGLPLYVIDSALVRKNTKAALAEVSSPTRSFVFPVISGGALRCLLFMDYDAGAKVWKRGMFGRANMAKLLAPVLKQWSAKEVALYLLPDGGEYLYSISSHATPNLTSLVKVTPGDDKVPLEPLDQTFQKIGESEPPPNLDK